MNMNRVSSRILPGGRAGWLARVLLVMGMGSLFIVAMTMNATVTLADGPGGNVQDPVIRAVDIAKPAVVRIITQINSQLVVHFSSGDVTFPQPGSSAGSSYPLTLSGSGTFISAHGDILTADHVVNPPQDASLSQFLDATAAQDVTNYINQHSNTQTNATQVSQELQTGQIASTPQYGQVASEAFLSTDYTGPLSAPDFQSLPGNTHALVDKIEAQSAVNQSDVAIVHVNMNDMPSVQLGDSSTVQQQDELTIIGFPGNGDVSTKPTDLLTSSVNKIEVSSIKTTDAGAQVIQVGGNVEHGDSGGPALDSNGNVVGIVSFGLSSQADPGGTSFLQASNSAATLVKSLNLNTTPGPFEKAWSQAFTDYSSTTAGHWHKASQEFQSLATQYPLFQAITPYVTYAQQQAKTEKVPATTATPTTHHNQGSTTGTNPVLASALTIGAIVLVVLLVILLFAMVVRRRGKRKTVAPAATQAAFGQPSRNTPPATIPQQASPVQPVQGIYNNATGQGIPGMRQTPPPPQPVIQPAQAGQSGQPDPYHDAMSAFGAPPTQAGQSGQYPNTPPASIVSGTLRPWPCGHMNRSNARYCSICGEPAPSAPTIIRRVEQ